MQERGPQSDPSLTIPFLERLRAIENLAYRIRVAHLTGHGSAIAMLEELEAEVHRLGHRGHS